MVRLIPEAAEAFNYSSTRNPGRGHLPEPAPATRLANFDEIRQEGAALAEEFGRHSRLETDLVQESVTTDLGAGG